MNNVSQFSEPVQEGSWSFHRHLQPVSVSTNNPKIPEIHHHRSSAKEAKHHHSELLLATSPHSHDDDVF